MNIPSFDVNAGFLNPITDFVKQSKRVLNVTHKPGKIEFRQIAYVTGIGMAIIGLTGFSISMIVHFATGRL